MTKETSAQYGLLTFNGNVSLNANGVNDWKPLTIGVTQLWKLEIKAKLQA